MNVPQRTYIAIDLKSFYASVECAERGLNALTTNLVVADRSRTDKTICLAVSPSLKALGIGGRPRLFEVVQAVKAINNSRCPKGYPRSSSAIELQEHPDWAVDYIVAPPRMSLYIDYSTRIHNIYLKYIAPEDIHVYSIDEVMIDATEYLKLYNLTARQLVIKIIREILSQTGITATAGIGTNLYLCKVAMDIVAKHTPPDKDGVRIAELDEMSYRHQLWDHRPITDFWRVGRGVANRLMPYGIDTMGKIARCSIAHEDLLYSLFGVNAELLIDHAWGWEPCTMAAIKSYKTSTQSLSHGQVLTEPYPMAKARLVAEEMAQAIALELTDKQLVAQKVNLHIGYDAENMQKTEIKNKYKGPTHTDYYGRTVPQHSNGTISLTPPTDVIGKIVEATLTLFDSIANPLLLIRRLTLTAADVIPVSLGRSSHIPVQLELFDDSNINHSGTNTAKDIRQEKLQKVMLDIKKQFGKNAILNGVSYNEGATARERNQQIGGHKA